MKIHESGEMYLETILILSKKNGYVRSVNVGEYMGFSKPSVSRAVGLLEKGGYILRDKDDNLILTEVGAEVANRIYERHRILAEFFMRLGVDEKTAVEDACKFEHDISEETFEAICRHMKDVEGKTGKLK